MVSHECLRWVLNSLKLDEMTPGEKAVQSRIKEAFACKISSTLWELIMESIQVTPQMHKFKISNKK